MKNKKQNEKKSITKSSKKEQNNFTGKRRARDINDIIINKYDIYSILDDLKFDQSIKIRKKKGFINTSENSSTESNKNEITEKLIKTENTNMTGLSDTGCGLTHLNENLIKTEESPSKIKYDNYDRNCSPKQSILKLILSETQLRQFSEILQIFTKEIESPFTLDYFNRLKETLKIEDKDKIITSLIFLVWSLKFMKIDNQIPLITNKNAIDYPVSFSLLPKISSQECKSPTFYYGENHSQGKTSPYKSSQCFCQHMSSNKCEKVTEYPLNCININPFNTVSGNYLIPFNILPGIPVINSSSYSVTNSKINNNTIQNKIINTAATVANIDNSGKNKITYTEVIHDSFGDANNTIDSILNNCGYSNSKNNQMSISGQNFTSVIEKDSENSESNYLNIKKEESFIDITLADEKLKEENFDKVFSEIIKIFSNPINEDTFKMLKNYLEDHHVNNIENLIKKNPFAYMNKKQYILLCKKGKEGLYLKIDPDTKKYTITRCFYKTNK